MIQAETGAFGPCHTVTRCLTMAPTTHTHAPDAFADCPACYALALRADRAPVVRAEGSTRGDLAPVQSPKLDPASEASIATRIVRHAVDATKRARALSSDSRVILGAFDSVQRSIGVPATATRSTADLNARVFAGESVACSYALDRDVTGALPRARMRVRPSQGVSGPTDAPRAFPSADTVTGARDAARGGACARITLACESWLTSTGTAKRTHANTVRGILSHWTDDTSVRDHALACVRSIVVRTHKPGIGAEHVIALDHATAKLAKAIGID